MKKATAFALVTLIFLITALAPAQEPENCFDDKEFCSEWKKLAAEFLYKTGHHNRSFQELQTDDFKRNAFLVIFA